MTDTIADTVPDDVLTDAPVTTNKDGSVRRKPGPKPGARRKAPAPGFKASATPRRSPSSTDYRPAILGLAQLPQVVLGLAAKFAKKDETKQALLLDGMTVGIHAPNVAEALNTTAQTEKSLAHVLDKLATVGPWSLVITAVMVPVAQVLANHNVIAPNEQLGVLSPEQLVMVAQAQAGA